MARTTSRKISWDVVRVAAVVAVMLGHITHQGPLAHPELDDYPFKITAQFGAAGLMTISGFFICQTIRRGHAGTWLWKKVARLLPPYVIAVLVTYLVMRTAGAAFSGQSLGGGVWNWLFGPTTDGIAWKTGWYVPVGADLLINLGMAQGWSPSFIWLDGSYWTLPVQLMVFAAAALLWSRTTFFRGRDLPAQLLAWGMTLLPLLIRFVVIGAHNPEPWAWSVVFGLGLHRMHAFAAGIGIWLWARNRMSLAQLALLLTAVVFAQDLHLYPDHVAGPLDPARMPSDIGFAVMLAVICVAAKGPDWVLLKRFAPFFSWFAGISFGVYLLHQELGYVLARILLDAGCPSWLRLPIVLAAAVAAGWCLTTLVERPVFNRLTRPRQIAPPPRSAPDDLLPGPLRAGEEGPAPVSVGGPS